MFKSISTITIDTKTGLNNVRRMALAKSDNRTVYAVNVTKAGNFLSTTKMAENLGCRLGAFPVEKSIAVLSGSNVVRIDAAITNYGFTKSFIVLTFETMDKVHQYLGKGIYIHFQGARTRCFYHDADVIRDLATDEEVDSSKVFKAPGVLRHGVRHYQAPGYTPSQQRKDQVLLFDTTKGWDTVASMVNEATYGAYKVFRGNKMYFKNLVKAVARMFQWQAPSKDFGTIGTYAIVNKEWTDVEGNKLWDGMSFIDSEFYASCMSELVGVKVAPESVEGEIVQNRPFTAKQLSVVVNANYVRALMATTEVVRFSTVDDAAAAAIVAGGKGKGDLADKMIIVGDAEIPEVIMDRNALKTDFDFNIKGHLNVLDIAKVSQANTSMQMLEKLIVKDRNAAVLFIKKMFDEQIIKEITDTVLDRDVRVPAIRDLESDRMWLTQIAQSIAPNYAVTKDKAMFRNIVENMVKRHMNMINKLKLAVEGSNLRLISDPAQMLGATNLLKFGEVFSKDAEKFFKGQGVAESEWKVTVFKYPTMGMKEFYAARVVGTAELKKRIKALAVSADVKKVLLGFYMTVAPAALVMPAVELLKSLLAGMDFDYDGASVVYNAEFNAITHKDNRPMIVNILETPPTPVAAEAAKGGSLLSKLRNADAFKNSKAFTEDYEFAIQNFAVTFIKQALSGNKSIGEVTNINSTQIALYFDLVNAKKAFTKAFPEGSKPNYIGLLPEVIEIDGVECDLFKINDLIIDQLIEEMQSVLFSDDNLRKMLFDLNVIYRYYQESIIDAAKTGQKINVKIEIGKLTWALSLTQMHGDLNWDGSEFKVYMDRSVEKKEDTFQDTFYKVKGKLVKELKSVIEEEFCQAKQEFSIEELAMFQKYAGKANKDLVDSLFMLKLMYNDLVAGHIKRLESSISEEDQDASKDEFKSEMAVLSAFARRLTEKFSPVERARVAKFASMISTAGIRADGGSQFAALALPEEYLMMLVQDFAEIDFAGQKLIANKGYVAGDMVEFKHGIAEQALVEANINGVFEIKEFNGSMYATKQIVDLVTIPAISNVAPVKLKDSSIKGREKEVMGLLTDADEVLVTAHSSTQAGKTVHDYAIYSIKDGVFTKIAEIDTRGALFNQMIDGAKAKVTKIAHNTIRAFKTNEDKTSIIVMLGDLEMTETAKNVSFEPGVEEAVIEVELTDDL